MLTITWTGSRSLSKALEGKLILEIIRGEILRVKVVGVDKVGLTECELGEVDMDDVSLWNDVISVRNPVVLGAHSLV